MPPRRAASAARPPTKAQLMSQIASETDLTKAQVESVFEALEAKMVQNLKRYKAFTVPGLLKVVSVHKPATAARMGPKPGSPGEMVQYKAKPARQMVRVRVLKGLKDQVA